jgi:GNAT superfamily N-acetyltransferase
VHIESPSVRSTREIVAFLGGESVPVDGEPADAPCPFKGLIALDGDALVGVVLGSEVPAIEPGESYVFPTVIVRASHRRRGIGRQLIEALAALPRTAPHVWAVSTPAEDDAITPLFLRAVGFERHDEAVVYERETDLPWAPRLGRFTVTTYDGADDARNGLIADLHRRAYRGRFGVPDLGPDGVKSWCGAMTCLVLHDGDRVAGCAFVNFSDTMTGVASILVARPYWASGAADALMDTMATVARERGRATIKGGVHRTNHASHAMVARHGWREVSRVPYLARRIGGG